jgi:hypothetical protein
MGYPKFQIPSIKSQTNDKVQSTKRQTPVAKRKFWPLFGFLAFEICRLFAIGCLVLGISHYRLSYYLDEILQWSLAIEGVA